MAASFDHIIKIGADMSSMAEQFAKQVKVMEKNSNIKITADFTNAKDTLYKELKNLQKLTAMSIDPKEWNLNSVYSLMDQASKQLTKALDSRNSSGIEKAQKQLLILESIGKQIKEDFALPDTAKFENIIEALDDAKDALANGILKDFQIDLSLVIPESSIKKQRDKVEEAIKQFQDISKVEVDFDLGKMVSGDDLKDAKASAAAVDELMQKNAQLSKQLDDITEKYNKLSDAIKNGSMPEEWQAEAQKELESFRTQLADAEAEIKAYQDYIGDLSHSEIDTADYDKAIEKQKQLQSQVESLAQSLKERDAQIQNLNERAEALVPKTDLEQKVSEIKKLTKEIEALQEESDRLKETLDHLSDISVNNTKHHVVENVTGLLDRYKEDQQLYHYDKAAMLYGSSKSKERIVYDGEDISDALLKRYKELVELQKNARSGAEELGKVNRELFGKNQELDSLKKQVEQLKAKNAEIEKEKELHRQAEEAMAKEAEAEKEALQKSEEKSDQLKKQADSAKQTANEIKKVAEETKKVNDEIEKASTKKKGASSKGTDKTTQINQDADKVDGVDVEKIKAEAEAFSKLTSTIKEVTEAGKEKTEELGVKEPEAVVKAIDEEIETFKKLVDAIEEAIKGIDIGNLIKDNIDSGIKSIDVSDQVDNIIKSLSPLIDILEKIKDKSVSIDDLASAFEKLRGITIPDFSSLGELNEALKMTKGRSAKFNEYATDIAEGINKIVKAFSEGGSSQQIDSFLKQIQRLSDSSSQFKEMITALSNLDKIGKNTSNAAVKDFDKATSDYITAYNNNAKKGNAESAAALAIANQKLEDTYKALNESVNQGLLSGEKVNQMYASRSKLISSSIAAIDKEKNANEDSALAVQTYIEASEKLYNAKIKQLNNPLDTSIDVSKLESDANAALDILKELRKQKKLTDEAFDSATSKGESFDAKYAEKAEALTTKRIQKIDSLLNNGGFDKVITKFESEFRIFGDLSDDLIDKLNKLRSNISTMSDETISDTDRIKTHMDFSSVENSLLELLRKVKEENPFEELSPKNTKYNFKEYVDAFDALQNKARELNVALSNKEPESVINALQSEVYKLKDALDDTAEKGDKLVSAQTKLKSVLNNFENKGLDEIYSGLHSDSIKKIDELNKKLKDNAIEYEDYVARITSITNELDRTAKYMNGSIVASGIDSPAKAMEIFKDSLSGVGTITKEITGDIVDNEQQVYRWTATYKEADGTIKQVTNTFDSVTQKMSSNTVIVGKELVGLSSAIDTLKKKYKELVVYWTSNMLTPQAFIRYFRQGIQVVQEYDDALVEMRKVSNDTEAALQNFARSSFEIANSVGTTGLTLQQSVADWLRLGEALDSAVESAKTTSILFNVSEFDSISAATDAMVSMSQAYKDISKIDLVNKLNVVGNNFAISTSGLAEALQDSASALSVAGNNVDEAIALITSANRVVQNTSEVGKGLRTVALRLTGTKVAVQQLQDLGEETENVITSVSKLRNTIRDATRVESNGFKGFDILTETGNYKDTYEINKMSPYQVIGMHYAIA